jgi:hypothetical protein
MFNVGKRKKALMMRKPMHFGSPPLLNSRYTDTKEPGVNATEPGVNDKKPGNLHATIATRSLSS